eukprot:5577211-Karenia_brevis.AAC.1
MLAAANPKLNGIEKIWQNTVDLERFICMRTKYMGFLLQDYQIMLNDMMEFEERDTQDGDINQALIH